MAAGNVEVIISAVDRASSVIMGVAGKAKGAFGALSKAAGLATLGMGVAGAAVGGIFALGNKLASDSQQALTSAASAANNWSSLTGDSFQQSKEVVADYTKALIKQAAVLPGTTQNYNDFANGVLDNVVGAYTDASGKIDKAMASTWIKENIAGLEMLRQASGSTSQQASKDVAKFLEGGYKSEGGMKRTLMFSANPTLMSQIRKAAEGFGYNSIDEMLKQASKKELADILGKATSKAITEDLKNELGNSFEGAMEGVKTQLFDPNVGLFGGLRKFDFKGVEVDLNRAMGSQITRVSKAVGTAFTHLGKAADYLGIETDPLVILMSAIDGLTSGFEAISNLITSIDISRLVNYFQPFADAMNGLMSGDGGLAGMGANVGKILGEVGGFIGDAISSGMSAFANLDTGTLFQAMQGVSKGLTEGLINMVKGINLGSLLKGGINLGAMSAGALAGVTQALGTELFTGWDLSPITAGISSLMSNVMAGISGFFSSMGAGVMVAVGQLGAAMSGIWSQVTAGISTALMTAQMSIQMGLATAGMAFMGIGAQVMGIISGIASSVGATISSGLAAIGATMSAGWQAVMAAGQAAVGSLAGIGGAIAGIISSGLQAIGSAIMSGIQSLMSQAQAAAANIPVIGGLFGGGGGGGGGGATARYSGQGVGTFQAAVKRETQKKPTGSELVVANSSELIIPQRELGTTMNALSSTASSGKQPTTVNRAGDNITIVVQGGASSPVEIAAMVEQRLKQRQRRAERTALA